MRILIVDNNIDPDSWGAGELAAQARKTTGATTTVRRAPQQDLPPDPLAFDRIVVSGSKTSVEEEAPWIEQLDDFIRRAVAASRPLLGVCYGHQALVRALGGQRLLRRAPRGEFGWVRIQTTDGGSPLFKGLAREFHSFGWHQDEAIGLPSGMRNLARSERCPIQACEVEGKPVFGVQFHPERSLEGARASLARRLKGDPKAECLGAGLDAKLFDASVGETIFHNFFSMENA